MADSRYNVIIIGGGIVGLGVALEITRRFPRLRLLVLEKEDRVARHQSGHNSGVIHSGLYYKPGSLKARLCAEGREAMYRFCQDRGIAHERCGKIVVATGEEELPRLQELHRRGEANGLRGIRWLTPGEIREYEPQAGGIRGLFVPQTGIVDYKAVALTLGQIASHRGCDVKTTARLLSCRRSDGRLVLQTNAGEFQCDALVNCSGLQSDRVARMCGVDPGVHIVPFRGEYYELNPPRQSLVKNLIYPVPDPRFPFLGVHFTRMIGGGVEAGPNAVLAWARKGYHRLSFNFRDALEIATFGGT